MEMQEETIAIVKGKRTKRQRIQSPPVADSSSATSAEEATGCITEEEEDMANCLILLAQGRARYAELKPEAAGEDGGGSKKPREYVVYECKTCSKCFPSFQALGGHRASHRKPKPAANEERRAVEDGDILPPICMNSFMKPMNGSSSNAQINTKIKLHECSICGAEFSSGQALGGHMRRHRPLVVATATAETQEAYKERSLLLLDLNLPAPVDEERVERPQPPPSAAFAFSDKRPLVDCHY